MWKLSDNDLHYLSAKKDMLFNHSEEVRYFKKMTHIMAKLIKSPIKTDDIGMETIRALSELSDEYKIYRSAIIDYVKACFFLDNHNEKSTNVIDFSVHAEKVKVDG